MMAIGNAMGINPGMVAGAVICGAMFGDKLSPLSDTTNLAPAVAGAKLNDHVRVHVVDNAADLCDQPGPVCHSRGSVRPPADMRRETFRLHGRHFRENSKLGLVDSDPGGGYHCPALM